MNKLLITTALLAACTTTDQPDPELPGDQVVGLDEFPLDDAHVFAQVDGEKCVIDLTTQPAIILTRAPAFLPAASPGGFAGGITKITDRDNAWLVSADTWIGDPGYHGAAVQLEPDGQSVLWRRCEP